MNVLRNGGYTHIIKLLGALHGLMQSEAISALTITSAVVLLELENKNKSEKEKEKENTTTDSDENPEDEKTINEQLEEGEENLKNAKFSDFEYLLVRGNIGEKLKHLIMQHGVKMDERILENIFTFLEIVTKFGEFLMFNFLTFFFLSLFPPRTFFLFHACCFAIS